MTILVDAGTRILIQGITGREAVSIVRGSLDYGARVVAGVTPGKGGREVHGVPVFDSVRRAVEEAGPIDVSVVSVPPGGARDAVFEAVEAGVPLLVVTTERVPRLDVAQLLACAGARGSRVVGPNAMGLIAPGRTKVGSIGGPAEDTQRAYAPGPVGILSRSGGMTTEIASLLTLHGLGQTTCVSIGGDPIVGSTFADLYALFEEDRETGVVVLYTEPGGTMEADLAAYLDREKPKTPGVVFVAGRFMDDLRGVRFGHAGTIVRGTADSAAEKIRLLREAGLYVADALSEVPDLVRRALGESRKARFGPAARRRRARAAAPPAPAAVEACTEVPPRPAAPPPGAAEGRGLFVNLAVADGCVHGAGCRVCIDACPVDIFAVNPRGPKVSVLGHLEDECILCGLCADRCPERVVRVLRLYEGQVL